MQNRSSLNKSGTLLIHLAVWAMVFLLPFIFTTENPDNENDAYQPYRTLDTVTNIFWVGLFYLNAQVFIPQLFYKKKYAQLAGALLASFALIMLLHGCLFGPLVPGKTFNFLRSSSHNIVAFLFTVMVSTTYKIIIDKLKADQLAGELQKENLKTELSFLRSQISPHFLFNLMNTIVAMARLKSEALEPTVIKLSGLLQYMLYETDDEKIIVKHEVESLQNYIDLQQLRFSSQLHLTANLAVNEGWHTIEPMLLIPFVENAFKHGNGLLTNPEILIDLAVTGNQLTFCVKNKFMLDDQAKDKTSGIGLANVQRRLQLLYPKRHKLKIEKRKDWFMVHLQIELK